MLKQRRTLYVKTLPPTPPTVNIDCTGTPQASARAITPSAISPSDDTLSNADDLSRSVHVADCLAIAWPRC